MKSLDDISELVKPQNHDYKESVLQEIIKKKSLEFQDGDILNEEKPEIDARSFRPRSVAQPRLNDTKFNLGAVENQEVELTIDELEKVLELKSQAVNLYKRNKHLETLSVLEKAINILPGDLDLLYYEALCLFQLGTIDKATQIFEKLVELDKGHSLPSLPKMYSLCLLRLERFQEAEKYLAAILDQHSYDTQFQNMIGYAQERLGKLLDAEVTFKSILNDHAENHNALNSLAYVYYRQNSNLDEALNLVNKALELSPENPAYLDTLGVIQFKRGKVDSARKTLKRALKRAPGSSEILAHINEIFKI